MRWFVVALAVGCAPGGDVDLVPDPGVPSTDTDPPTRPSGITPSGTDTPPATGTDTDTAAPPDTATTAPPPACAAVDPTLPVLPALPPITIVLEDHDVIYGMPAATPKAVLLFFHGAGGSAIDATGSEQTALQNQLAPFGWGYVAVESAAQGFGATWDTSHDPDNPDLARVARALDEVAALTSLEPDTPIVPVGFSNGGSAAAAFIDVYGSLRPIVAADLHNTNAGDVAVPSIWMATVNDHIADPAGMEAMSAAQVAAGRVSEYHLQGEQVLSPAMLLRKSAIDQASADELFADLVARGMVASDGTRLLQGTGGQLGAALDDWAAESGLVNAQRASDLTHSIWALHRFNGYQADVECAFLTQVVP